MLLTVGWQQFLRRYSTTTIIFSGWLTITLASFKCGPLYTNKPKPTNTQNHTKPTSKQTNPKDQNHATIHQKQNRTTNMHTWPMAHGIHYVRLHHIALLWLAYLTSHYGKTNGLPYVEKNKNTIILRVKLIFHLTLASTSTSKILHHLIMPPHTCTIHSLQHIAHASHCISANAPGPP